MSSFRQARDFLLEHRSDAAAARAGFSWPDLPTFNWAIDWFDAELAALKARLSGNAGGER